MSSNLKFDDNKNVELEIYNREELITKISLLMEEGGFGLKFGLFRLFTIHGKYLLLRNDKMLIKDCTNTSELLEILAKNMKDLIKNFDYIRISEIDNIDDFHDIFEKYFFIYQKNKENQINYFVNIGNGFDNYLNDLKSKKSRELRREVRKLFNYFDDEIILQKYTEEKQIDDFLSYANEIYLESWKSGTINNVDSSNIYALASDKKWLGYIMFAKGEAIAFVHGLVNNNRYELIVNGYKVKFKKINPGKVILFEIFKSISDGSINIVDFGSGESAYKRTFSNESRKIYSAILARKKSTMMLFLFLQKILDSAYRLFKVSSEKLNLDKYVRRIVRGG